ncbi:replication protein A 70 kDa DNA-binding subunit B-like [Capsicum galapagoense]
MARVDYISEILNYKMDWNFKVRVVHMWHATPRDKPNFLLSIELVFQDEKGENIHATISRSVVHRFRGEKNAIKEMGLYLMNTFVVEPNNVHYKTTAHKFKLEFTPKTIVVETTDPAFGLNIFKFRSFNDLKNHIDINDTQLFDFIGQVVCHAEK